MSVTKRHLHVCAGAGVAALFAAAALAGTACAQDVVIKSHGHMMPTGGTLDFGDKALPEQQPRRVRLPRPKPTPTTAATVPQPDWLYDFIDLVLGPAPVPRPRRTLPKSGVALALPNAPGAGAPPRSQPLPPVVTAVPGAAPSSPLSQTTPSTSPPLVTGAIDRPRTEVAPSTLPSIHQDDLDAAIVGDAEISQAREDIVKLELARRTYEETRLSGQFAFDQRIDWRVLERGRDAWNDTELSSAIAAGFEANTYINDTTRTIVVAIAGTQDLRRDFLAANIWEALIQAQAPQQFYLAKSYIRSVQARYQGAGYQTECVGHSLGGGACAYAASELGIRAIVVNPISAGKLGDLARNFVTNYVVDGDIAAAVYALRGNGLSGDVHRIRHDRDAVRRQLKDRYGFLAGPIRVVRDLQNSVKVHQIERALDIIAGYAGTQRVK